MLCTAGLRESHPCHPRTCGVYCRSEGDSFPLSPSPGSSYRMAREPQLRMQGWDKAQGWGACIQYRYPKELLIL